MEIKGDKAIFTTGKEVYANCGTIGLSPHGEGGDGDIIDDGWQVSEGYDGGFGGYCSEGLTNQERVELADYMISLWEEFKEKYNQAL